VRQVAEGAPAAAEAAAGQHALEAACARLVVVDGAVAPALSDVGGLPGGAYLGGLAGAPAELVGPHLARALPSAEAGAQGVGARLAGTRRGRSLPPASSGGARCYREKQPASERRQGRSVTGHERGAEVTGHDGASPGLLDGPAPSSSCRRVQREAGLAAAPRAALPPHTGAADSAPA